MKRHMVLTKNSGHGGKNECVVESETKTDLNVIHYLSFEDMLKSHHDYTHERAVLKDTCSYYQETETEESK